MNFSELSQQKSKLDQLRPIPPEQMEIIDEKLTIEWTYNSNAIEGNTLSLEETAFFIKRGLTVRGKSMVEHLEAQNHVEAVRFLQEVVKGQRPLTEGLIKELHALLMRGIDWVWIGPSDRRVRRATRPGQYKIEPNHVIRLDGKVHYYVDPFKVTDEMEKLLQYYSESNLRLHPVELAAQLHYGFVAIHPFVDGNGRVARLLMNLILLQNDYPPAVIRNEAREDYYRALMSADEGDLLPFITLITQEVQRTFDVIFEVIEKPVRYGPDDVTKQLDRLERQVRRRTEAERESEQHLEQRWNNISQIRDQLESFFQRYASRGNLVKMRVDSYEGSLNNLAQPVKAALPQDLLEEFWNRFGAVRLMIVAATAGKQEILGYIIGLVFEASLHYHIAVFPSLDSSLGGLNPLGDRFRLIQARNVEEMLQKESQINDALVNSLRAIQI